MNRSLNPKTMSFVIATTVMTRFGSEPYCEDSDPETEITVMFLAGPQNNAMAKRDMAALAKRTGKDIVFLEFEPGAAEKGPKNIVVFEMRDGELTMWPRCALWSRQTTPLTVILPRGSDVAFGYDGVCLRRMTGAPTEGLAPGFAAAKAELRIIAGRMTPEILDEIKTVKKHVFPRA